jgi:hypothetical protein
VTAAFDHKPQIVLAWEIHGGDNIGSADGISSSGGASSIARLSVC